MKWSWKIGEFLGISVYMHATFPLLLAFVALPVLFDGGDLWNALSSVLFVLVLFVCVVLHEYGHALAARRYGIRTQDITLLPIGGVARLERMPEKPSQELVVAAAGPLVNVVIAALLFTVMWFAGVTLPTLGLGWGNESFLEQLLTINIALVVFNMIPAFPMDGGRILRALLATRMDHARATRYAAWLGQGIAVLFGIAGFFVNPLLVVTALFIFFGAQAEAEMAQNRANMSGFTVEQAMRTNIRALAPYEWLSHAVDHSVATGQQDFPIVENGRVVGMLTRNTLMRGLQQFGAYAPISAIMQSDVTTIEAEESLADASETMQENQVRALPVTHNGALVGLLTLEGIREFLRVQAALGRMRHQGTQRVV
ncbi:MAG: site-2 protease family protein [Chloroflexi bacterium]|nr:site-2 protease family protein [Chloroflexota bacterium]